MISKLLGFLFAMWVLILIGGGILVNILGPISFSEFGDFNWIFSSGLKGVFSIALVILWIFVLYKMKNWIFKNEIKS